MKALRGERERENNFEAEWLLDAKFRSQYNNKLYVGENACAASREFSRISYARNLRA